MKLDNKIFDAEKELSRLRRIKEAERIIYALEMGSDAWLGALDVSWTNKLIRFLKFRIYFPNHPEKKNPYGREFFTDLKLSFDFNDENLNLKIAALLREHYGIEKLSEEKPHVE